MSAKKRILLVDDEPNILFFVQISLSAAGYDVVTARGGAKALELAQADKFDLMMLDMVMSPVSGIEVLDILRTFSRVPVLACTARHDYIEAALKHGATDYINKPFIPDDLLAKVKALLKD
jgi:two-component system, OmpR family, KDP operon response regulator KdpE